MGIYRAAAKQRNFKTRKQGIGRSFPRLRVGLRYAVWTLLARE
jgi:hypothetical protein